jgi:hypothetical protein
MNIQEIEKKIIAIQLIQELIVDILDEAKIIERSDFETLLSERVKEYNSEKESMEYPMNIFNTPMGEA